jgi:pilus assembly protein CpaB
MTRLRWRGLLLLSLALASGGLAASEVHERERSTAAAAGPLVGVVVAGRDLGAGRRLRPDDLAVKRVPVRFVPPDALGGRERLVGARTAVAVAAGGYVTTGALAAAASEGGGPLRPGQRDVEVAVGGGSALAGAAAGARVDVLVSTRRQEGAGRTFIALEDVELLGLRPGAADASQGASALATLRVTVRQAVYLAAAANFAEEVRLLVRPPGDRGRVGAAEAAEP